MKPYERSELGEWGGGYRFTLSVPIAPTPDPSPKEEGRFYFPAYPSVARISRSKIPGSLYACPAPSMMWKSASGHA